MCLEQLFDNEYKEEATNIGYKVFKIDGNKKLYSVDKCVYKSYKKRRWIHDNNDYCINGWYKTGFHVFLTRAAAIHYRSLGVPNYEVIYKVKFKNVVAYGSQLRHKVVVVRDMLIMEKI